MKRKNKCSQVRKTHAPQPFFEVIESRMLLSVSTTPSGLTPIEVRQAYGFSSITFTSSTGQAVEGDGAGQTIAIVDPYNATTIASDLDTFDKAFTFDSTGQTIYQEFGTASSFLSIDSLGKGESDPGWALEVALDVEWAHAIAPDAKIDLVEAASASTNDLLAAVKTAADLPGVSVVSMSWGGSEAPNESTFDSAFTTPSGHTGVTFVAAAGDNGATAEWPAVSPNVLSVGGTTLNVSSTGTYISESAWSDGGGGYSSVESEPSYQDNVNTTGLRSTPDVSYDANPNSGFSVYTSVKQSGQTGWFTVGGTSAGAPQWSALIAIADQGRANAGEANLDGASQTLPYLYEMSSTSFHDITSGSNGYRATTGYDLATGLGSPVANVVVANLVTPPTSTTGGTGTGTGTGSGSGSGSGTGTGTGTGSGSGGTSHGWPPPFHMPVGHFPNRFHRWDVTDSDSAASSVVVNPSVATNPVHPSAGPLAANATGGNAGGDGITGTGLFGSGEIAAVQMSSADAAVQVVVTSIIPVHFAAPISISTPASAPFSSGVATQPFSSAAPVTDTNETMQNIFSTQSVAASISTMFSHTFACVSEDGLEASMLVLPLIAFWAYQSRLSKSRGVNSLHWISMD